MSSLFGQVFSRASGSRPIIGLSDSREGARFLHDHIIPVDATAHAVDRYLALPRAFGIDVKTDTLSFPLAPGQAPKDWPQRDDLIVIHPCSRGVGKSLSNDALQSLCDSLSPHPVVLVGMSDDQARPTGAHITDFSHRTTLGELIWVLRRARWVISVDSGPMHIAAAVNDRTLALHTWSDPRKVGPYNPRASVWKAGRMAHRRDFTDAEASTEAEISLLARRVPPAHHGVGQERVGELREGEHGARAADQRAGRAHRVGRGGERGGGVVTVRRDDRRG